MRKKFLTLVAITLMMVFSQFQLGKVQAQAPKPEQKAKFQHPLDMSIPVPQSLGYSQDDYGLITLWWSENLNARSYFVYASETEDGEFTKVALTDRTQFSDRMDCGSSRYYFVTAFDGQNESWPSNVVQAYSLPCIYKVKGLKVEVTHPGYPTNGRDVVLSWDYDPNVVAYRIYSWKTWDTNIQWETEVNWDWNVQSLPCGFAFVYWVTAVVGTYETPWSDPIAGVVSCEETVTGPTPTFPVVEKKVFIPFAATP